MKNNRHLTVYRSTGYYADRETPQILMQGKWLRDAGFEVGDGLDLKVQENEIVITRIPRPVEGPKRPQKKRLAGGGYIIIPAE